MTTQNLTPRGRRNWPAGSGEFARAWTGTDVGRLLLDLAMARSAEANRQWNAIGEDDADGSTRSPRLADNLEPE